MSIFKSIVTTREHRFFLLTMDEWRTSWLFYSGGPYYIFLSLQSVRIFVLLQLINVDTTTNYNLVVLQQTAADYKLSDWIHFWNKCRNLPFLAIVIEQSTNFLSFSFLIDCFMSVFCLTVCVGKFWKIEKISSITFHCIWKWRQFENTDRNILPKTYSFKRYFGIFRLSET